MQNAAVGLANVSMVVVVLVHAAGAVWILSRVLLYAFSPHRLTRSEFEFTVEAPARTTRISHAEARRGPPILLPVASREDSAAECL